MASHIFCLRMYGTTARRPPDLKRSPLIASAHGSGRAGSIPACAGEPQPSACSAMPRRVHPRVCGGAKSCWGSVGASRCLAQRTKKYSLLLPFTETYISRDGANYVILCRLKDYMNFITDENGDLRRYLFEGNVRDYLGDVQVNSDIASSFLEARASTFGG
jgi:hypothetical protein